MHEINELYSHSPTLIVRIDVRISNLSRVWVGGGLRWRIFAVVGCCRLIPATAQFRMCMLDRIQAEKTIDYRLAKSQECWWEVHVLRQSGRAAAQCARCVRTEP